MPATITRTVYTYGELSDKAKEKAIEACRHWNVDDSFWFESLIDMQQEELQQSGVYDAEISFAGFWSQGDGASFGGSINLAEWMRARKIAGKYRALYNAARDPWSDLTASASLEKRHGYSNYQSWYPEIEIRDNCDDADRAARVEQQADEVREIMAEWHRDESHRIYRNLRDEYEYQTSDEVIAEMLIANETQFNEDGELYY